MRPSNRFTVTHVDLHRNGSVTATARFPGPGVVNLMTTAWHDNVANVVSKLPPAPGRFVVGRRRLRVRDRTVHLTVTPNRRDRRLVAHPAFPVVLRFWVNYAPARGTQRNIGYYGLRVSRPPRSKRQHVGRARRR